MGSIAPEQSCGSWALGQGMGIRIEPTGAAVGARIYGVDLSQDISEQDFKAIHQAWLDHLVIIFPGQTLTEEDQVRFTLRFGEMPKRKRYEGRPEANTTHQSIMLVSNIRENGRPIGSLPDGEMMFHSDGAYDVAPYRYTLLYAVELPSHGGDTLFANMYRAYETLPEDVKQKLAGCHGVQGYYSGSVIKGVNAGDYSGEVMHPLFVRHEETGRTALFASRLMTVRIAELSQQDSDELLAVLFDHIERADNVYAHRWTVGDFVAWDNRCTVHARTDFPENERRLLRRTTVQGTAPGMAT